VAVAQSYYGSIALSYVLPVLWMTSRLALLGSMAWRGRPDLLVAISYVLDGGRVSRL